MSRLPGVLPVTAGRRLPYGLMSLWDMLNRFPLDHFADILNLLRSEEEFGSNVPGDDPSIHLKIIERLINLSRGICEQLDLPTTKDRLDSMERLLKVPEIALSYAQTEFRVLRETMTSESSRRFLFHVNHNKVEAFLNKVDATTKIWESFRDASSDWESAHWCYCYEENTASVFHCMRVLEHGLRALAKKVGVSFTVQQWQNVIDQIESKITGMQKVLTRGKKRNETLQFYSEAAKEFRYFKDGWRNYAAHAHASYDEHQAASVLQHVGAFMAHLSKKLGRKRPSVA